MCIFYILLFFAINLEIVIGSESRALRIAIQLTSKLQLNAPHFICKEKSGAVLMRKIQQTVKFSQSLKRAQIFPRENVIICGDDFDSDEITSTLDQHHWMASKMTWIIVGQLNHGHDNYSHIIFYDIRNPVEPTKLRRSFDLKVKYSGLRL